MEATLRPRFDAALAEYIAAQEVSLDMPGAQFNLAIVYENTGRRDQAERHYLGALRINPDSHSGSREPGSALCREERRRGARSG